MNSIQAKEKFAAGLMRQASAENYTSIVLYIVYKTIEANDNITLNQLRWALGAEYLLKDDVIDGAVASLTSKSIFNCVKRYQPPRAKVRTISGAKPVHLRAIKQDVGEFKTWLAALLITQPELAVFRPQTFVQRDRTLNAPTSLVKEI